MGLEIDEFESTPNPNAVKCVLKKGVPGEGESPRSYRTAEAAKNDSIAAGLFRIEGVTGVLIGPGWITVNKRAEVEWKGLKEKIRAALKGMSPG
ncbi:MAG TPA: NifU N-terminal domain-containing protein [Phycisphaerales bacterium]|nr:NifU N-terminal domain-containing protein [Phycisphaerales bacterium]